MGIAPLEFLYISSYLDHYFITMSTLKLRVRSVTDWQGISDDISAIHEAANIDGSMSNNEKRQIAKDFTAGGRVLHPASLVSMAPHHNQYILVPHGTR